MNLLNIFNLTPEQLRLFIHNILVLVVTVAQAYYTLVLTLSALIGVVLIGSGLLRFAQSSRNGSPYGLGTAEVIIGALFINLTAWLDGLSMDIMSVAAADNPLNYSVAGNASGLQALATTAIVVIEAVGLWGVVRGLWLMRESVYDRKAFWMALTHTFFGVLALNIPVFAAALDASAGGALSSSINLIGAGS